MYEQILSHSSELIALLLGLSGFLLFLSIILRLQDLRELILGFRRMQSTVVSMERTINELQAEVRRAVILQAQSAAETKSVAETLLPAKVVSDDGKFTNDTTELSLGVSTDGNINDTDAKSLEEAKWLAPPATYLSGLAKSRKGLGERLRMLFSGPSISAEQLDEVQAQLLGADLGPKVVARLRETIESETIRKKSLSQPEVERLFATEVEKLLITRSGGSDVEASGESPKVILIVGVNGVGKTTTAAKLAKRYTDKGQKVLLVAADTFRAAAVEQLKIWGERVSVPVSFGPENSKPQTVVFDAAQKAVTEKFNVVIVDTAGRLHNKANLMQELEGIKNALSRHIPGSPHEVLLVLDGTTGQNALVQAREFKDAVNISGIVVTKLDGTAKGGVLVAVSDLLQLPVLYVGLGEKEKDLVEFNGKEFAEALFIEK